MLPGRVAAIADHAPTKQRQRLLSAPRFGPLAGAFVFWVLSLWPTLLPRSWFIQGALSGVCAAIGWLIGLGVGHAVHHLLRRLGRQPSATVRRIVWGAAPIVALVVVVAGLLLWRRWQNDQRDVIGMPDLGPPTVVPMLLVSLVVLAVLVLIGRLVATFFRWIDRHVARVVPLGWGRALITVGVIVALVIVARFGRRGFVDWADESFGAVNNGTPDDVTQPSSAVRSGSPDSLVAWESLGFQGRAFTGGGPTVQDLTAFAGPDADVVEPVRVYVGLDSADTPEERTDLALRELDRTGAWDREVLVVATATGTGWINPDAGEALELMYHGDSAIVSQQYSFLPSWIAFLVDPANASSAGRDLFDAVHERWSELPADARPRLLVYGESLGSLGGEAAFESDDVDAALDALFDRTEGTLFVGPTYDNPIYSKIVDGRDRGTPSWRPELERFPGLRVANTVTTIDPDDAAWTEPRVLYLHHPTDPVGTWSPAALWRPPAWTDDPVGFAVPERVMWVPIVTWVQETVDLMNGFSAEPGFGHDYTDALVAAWAAVAPPEGWTAVDTERLQDHIE